MALKVAAKEIVASGSVTTAVDAAIELNREVNAASKELEVLKGFIRKAAEAKAALEGGSNTELEGSLGVAQVVFPKAAPKAKKGVDLLSAEAALPEAVFATLFTKRVVVEFAPDFEEKMATLTPAQKAALANLVEVVAATPRVNLPK